LKRNKAIYDAERFREWGERKLMKKEQEYCEMVYTMQEQSTMKSKNIKAREHASLIERERKWEQDM